MFDESLCQPRPCKEVGKKSEKTLIIRDRTLKNGFTPVPNAVLESKSLSLGAKVVYALLLKYAWQSGEAFPGQGRLAESTGCTERTIRTYLTELKSAGLISWRRRGLTKTNIYYINDLREFLDRKSASGQEGKNPERINNTPLDRKPRSGQNRKHDSDKEYSDQEDTDQKYPDSDLSLDSNSSLRSELESKLRTQNLLDDLEDVEVPDELFEDDSPILDNETGTYELYQADPNLTKAPEGENTHQLSTDPGAAVETLCSDESFDKAPGRTDSSHFDGTTVRKEGRPSPGIKNKNTCPRPEKDMPGELEPSKSVKSIKESSGRDNFPIVDVTSAAQENNNHTPGAGINFYSESDHETDESCKIGVNLTAGDIIAVLGDSLREVMSPPAKAYAIAGRLYNLYDFPAAEAAINALRRRIEQGYRVQNPISYLMKVAREKKKEFEIGETQDFEEQKLFSEKYPEEHKKRLEEAKKIYAERQQYLGEYFGVSKTQTASVDGFRAPMQVVMDLAPKDGDIQCRVEGER